MASRDRLASRSRMSRNRRLVMTALFTGLALAVNILEGTLPTMLPGVKAGLANSVSLVALLILGWKEAIAITLMRTLLGSLFSGNIIVLACSVTGGILSVLTMALLYNRSKMNLPTISVTAAIVHNIGQLMVVSLIVENIKILSYLPILMISSIVTGYCVGMLSLLLYRRLNGIIQ